MQKNITSILEDRIAVMDGAMGTMIQSYNLNEADFRGEIFSNWNQPLKGNNDILSITQPDIIQEIHEIYLDAGADIITTNTFNANRISQADYSMGEHVYNMNLESARIARRAADRFTKLNPDKPRFVLGDLGPTNQTCSMSPDVSDPSYRAVEYDLMAAAYEEQVRAFMKGGVDILIVETVFDTLNCKAALFAIQTVFDDLGRQIPVMVSGTITDKSGRILSGQTVEAFWYSVRHLPLLSIGLNCAFGAQALRPYIQSLASIADVNVSIHPNAGLPDELGNYRESPQYTADILAELASEGLLNIIGGCCGTTPEHIQCMSETMQGLKPRIIPDIQIHTRLAGLEPLDIRPESLFSNVGERTNVAGSLKFKKLIKNEEYESALEVARQQVNNGAQIIDVNMDESLLDSEQAMKTFLLRIAAEPDISRVPVMIDSSKWSVIETGLKCIQGKPIVNSLSLKEGEDIFLKQARIVKKYGAAIIVMAFDEKGQADTLERRIQICVRAYDLLTTEAGIRPEDIIFDPNIFAVATGMSEHNSYAADFIKAVRQLKKRYPQSLVSGGVSNVSFSFRGNNTIREYIHSVFLYHAIEAGMDMGIVNAGQLAIYEHIPEELRIAIENVILNRSQDAADHLISLASTFSSKSKKITNTAVDEWRQLPLRERIIHSMVYGLDKHIQDDVEDLRKDYNLTLDIVEGPLMDGMNKVGELFGAGKMFLPQVVKSARVMKKAVAYLEPYLLAEKSGSKSVKGKIIMATVKGDVHDIGKNIVSVVLECNNFQIIDLGVMVNVDRIIDAAIEEEADMIGLSGLITPSLDEMIHVAGEMERRKLNIPLLIGGATTSRLHTAIKIDQKYNGPVIHVTDASQAVPIVNQLVDPEKSPELITSTESKYAELAKQWHDRKKSPSMLPYSQAVKNPFRIEESGYIPHTPNFLGITTLSDYPIHDLIDYIDWTPFFHTWDIHGKYPDLLTDDDSKAANTLFTDGKKMLERVIAENLLTAKAIFGLFPASSDGDDIRIYHHESGLEKVKIHNLRQQMKKTPGKPNYCLSDFLYPSASEIPDYIGAFAVTAGIGLDEISQKFKNELDDYQSILIQSISDRLAEALAEKLHEDVRMKYWGYGETENFNPSDLLNESYSGIRPAPGYPANPDHSEKKILFDLLEINNDADINLTEGFALDPPSSICGWYYGHPESQYFSVGKISSDQVENYRKRKGLDQNTVNQLLQTIVSSD